MQRLLKRHEEIELGYKFTSCNFTKAFTPVNSMTRPRDHCHSHHTHNTMTLLEALRHASHELLRE